MSGRKHVDNGPCSLGYTKSNGASLQLNIIETPHLETESPFLHSNSNVLWLQSKQVKPAPE